MTATESYGERSRRGDDCCLYGSLNLQIESKTRKRDEVEDRALEKRDMEKRAAEEEQNSDWRERKGRIVDVVA